MAERTCEKCQVLKPIDDFYKTSEKAHRYVCKNCMCMAKRKKTSRKKRIYVSSIITSFSEIPEETLTEIKKDIEIKTPLTCIARKYGFRYNHIIKWRKHGLL